MHNMLEIYRFFDRRGKNLRFDTDRLKAEGVNSWEAFVSNYL